MFLDVAKRNRLNGKFKFSSRDWRVELDEFDDEFMRLSGLHDKKDGQRRTPRREEDSESTKRQQEYDA